LKAIPYALASVLASSLTGIALAHVRRLAPVVFTLIMSSATIQTDHEAQRSPPDDGALGTGPAAALESLLEFQPELASGEELVVTDRRTLLIVDCVASPDEFVAEERFTFENLWPEIDSLELAQREFPQRSFSHPDKARKLLALARIQRSFSSITWAWIRPFTWGAAVGATTVFLLTYGARQTPPTNAPLSSTRVPFALTTFPSVVREDRIVVTTPPVVRPRLETRPQAPDSRPARATAAAPEPRTVSPFIGGVEITSTPEGARVFVNGRLEGITPLVIDGLPIGTRAVRVEAQGYDVWSSSLRVVANERTAVRVTLTHR
jgi:PEGA domain-containing protein